MTFQFEEINFTEHGVAFRELALCCYLNQLKLDCFTPFSFHSTFVSALQVVQRDVMRGLHLAVSQAWRQPSLFVAGHACHTAGTSFTTASGSGSNGNGGGCGAGRSAAALLRHEQQQQRHEDGSSSSRLVPSDAELYYAYVPSLIFLVEIEQTTKYERVHVLYLTLYTCICSSLTLGHVDILVNTS